MSLRPEERASGVFTVATECGYGPTKGSEFPLTTGVSSAMADGGCRGESLLSLFYAASRHILSRSGFCLWVFRTPQGGVFGMGSSFYLGEA